MVAKDKKKGAPAEKKKTPRNLHEKYTVSGESVERKNRTCPKCGPGMFLGAHKDRFVCGKCAYVEYASKKEEAQAE